MEFEKFLQDTSEKAHYVKKKFSWCVSRKLMRFILAYSDKSTPCLYYEILRVLRWDVRDSLIHGSS
jgi:hypothetical protein